jgi:glutaredoxin 3
VEYNLQASLYYACEYRREVLGATREKTEIKLYSGAYCPYCLRVKNELERLGLDYETVNADADGRVEVVRLSGQRKIPILTIGDEVLADSAHIIRELRKRYA